VDFLNSVIVDMQRKNDELKAKLDLLESAGIFESLDINDMIMMNGVDRGKVAPRLFCDICDR
jgi:CAP-Gly domain-containing linker protein 1